MADSKQIVKRHYEEVWNQSNFEGMDDLYDASYEAVIPLVGKVNRAGLKAAVSAYRKAFPDLRFELESVIQEDDTLAVRWRASGTSRGEFMGIPATSKFGTVAGLSMFELRNGKVAREISEMDLMAFFDQMGLQPPAGPTIAPQPQAPAPH